MTLRKEYVNISKELSAGAYPLVGAELGSLLHRIESGPGYSWD